MWYRPHPQTSRLYSRKLTIPFKSACKCRKFMVWAYLWYEFVLISGISTYSSIRMLFRSRRQYRKTQCEMSFMSSKSGLYSIYVFIPYVMPCCVITWTLSERWDVINIQRHVDYLFSNLFRLKCPHHSAHIMHVLIVVRNGFLYWYDSKSRYAMVSNKRYTVHYLYIAAIFLWKSHERHPIARPWGRDNYRV